MFGNPMNPANPMNLVNPISPWCAVCDPVVEAVSAAPEVVSVGSSHPVLAGILVCFALVLLGIMVWAATSRP